MNPNLAFWLRVVADKEMRSHNINIANLRRELPSSAEGLTVQHKELALEKAKLRRYCKEQGYLF